MKEENSQELTEEERMRLVLEYGAFVCMASVLGEQHLIYGFAELCRKYPEPKYRKFLIELHSIALKNSRQKAERQKSEKPWTWKNRLAAVLLKIIGER